MALYDDASLIFLGSAAARTDTKDFSKIQCVKPVEAVSSTDLVINGDFSIDGPATDGALTTGYGSYGWNTVATDESANVQEGTTTIKNGVLKLTNASGDVDCRAYITNGSNSRNVLTTNSYYKLVYTIVENDGCTDFKIYNGAGAAEDAPSSVGTHTRVVRNTSNQLFLFFNKTESSSISIDNVSLKEFTTRNADFDISRDDNLDATRVGPTGLIEKGRENLIKYSNGFDTGTGSGGWAKTSSSVTSGQGGYDGSTDAYKLQATATGSSTNSLTQTVTLTNIVTVSVFAKAGSNVSGTQILRLSLNEYLTSDSSQKDNSRAFFDLSDGSVVSTGGNIIATNSDSFGGGWFRLSITVNIPSTNTVNKAAIFMGNGGTTINDQTDGDFFFVQDFQAEAGLVATDVITTTSAAATVGIKEDEPRFDYPLAGGAPSFLLEPERQNKFAYSEYMAGTFGTVRSTFTANAGISPEGVQNATAVFETATGVDGGASLDPVVASSHGFQKLDIDIDDGKFYSYSFFVKANGRSKFLVQHPTAATLNTSVTVDLSGTPSVTEGRGAATGSQSIVDYGDGWYRVEINGKEGLANDDDGNLNFFFHNGTQTDYLGDVTKGLLFYGFQLEEGKSCTSYIPTHGAAATRSRDDVAALDTSGFSFGTTCTIFYEGVINEATADHVRPVTMFGSHGSPADAERYLLFATSFSGTTYTLSSKHNTTPSSTLVSTSIIKGGLTIGAKVKCASVFSGTSFKFFVNGALADSGGTATITAASIFNSLDLSQVAADQNHSVGSIMLWGSALTDQQCIDLTTL